jgi:DNA-binding NarL/FixJ family response regulator
MDPREPLVKERVVQPIRVLLADDHAITREGTRQLLEAEAEFTVVAEAGDGEEAVRLTQELQPDILLLDISMPRLNGIQVAQAIRRSVPETKIVVLTGYDNEQYAQVLVHLGARGYLSKTTSSQELMRALRFVYAGHVYYQPSIETDLASSATSPALEEPTARELEVLRLVAKGLRNADIAQQLLSSHRTVQFHLSNLFLKLGANSRTEVVHMARQKGWIE